MVESVDTKDLNSFGQQWLCGFKSRFGYNALDKSKAYRNAVVAQLVEHWLPKPKVTSSRLAYRSLFYVCILWAEYVWYSAHIFLLCGNNLSFYGSVYK